MMRRWRNGQPSRQVTKCHLSQAFNSRKEEPSFPAEHAEEQTPPEMLTDTAAEGLSDSEVGREEEEEQREQQPEKLEEPFSPLNLMKSK